jgi:hypothetical protein
VRNRIRGADSRLIPMKGRRTPLTRIYLGRSPFRHPAFFGNLGSGRDEYGKMARTVRIRANRCSGLRTVDNTGANRPARDSALSSNGCDVERLNDARILIYSHDSFGLGHLRRCRAIAHAVVERFKGVSVLILSGSPIIGSFDFRSRVDFVRIPGVIKLSDGEYQSLGLHIDLEQTMEMRAAIIHQTALSFRPDLFIVDKEPLGLKGEVVPTLQMLKAQGTRLVLGPARHHGRAEAPA